MTRFLLAGASVLITAVLAGGCATTSRETEDCQRRINNCVATCPVPRDDGPQIYPNGRSQQYPSDPANACLSPCYENTCR